MSLTATSYSPRLIRALGVKLWAKDASPDEVADALENFQREATEKAKAAEKTMSAADDVELIPEEADILPVDECGEPEFTMNELGPRDNPGDVLSFFNGRSHADGVKAYTDYLTNERRKNG